MAIQQAVARRENPSELMKKRDVGGLVKAMSSQLAAALPDHLRTERFARLAMTSLRKNPRLMDCEPASLLGAMMEMAALGLEPGPGQLVHLIPYGRECQLQIGFRGYIELARRAGIIIHQPKAVFEGDEFTVDWGRKISIHHKPAFKAEGWDNLRATWCKATQYVHMHGEVVSAVEYGEPRTRTYCEGIRDRKFSEWQRMRKRYKKPDGFESWNSPWRDHPVEMAKKTAVRHLAKSLAWSPELSRAMARDGEIITGLTDEGYAETVIDVEPVEEEEKK